MASVDEFLVEWKDSQADLKAIVGGRMTSWDAGRSATFPRIVYYLVTGSSIKTLARPTSLRREMWRLEVQAETKAAAREVADLLIGDPDHGDLRLDGYAGAL